MKIVEENKLIDFLRSVFTDAETVEIEASEDAYEMRIHSMYEAPDFNLPKLMEVAKFLETMNINEVDHFSIGGCETCDYWSEYGFTLIARPDDGVGLLLSI